MLSILSTPYSLASILGDFTSSAMTYLYVPTPRLLITGIFGFPIDVFPTVS